MRAFKSFNIRVNFITGNELQWALNVGFKDNGPYNFIVQASSTLDFSEILYTINAGDSFFAIDASNIKQNWSKDMYFRVQLSTGDYNNISIYYSEVLAFDSAPTTKRKYRMAADIMRKNNVWFKFAGFQGYLLKRKIYGAIDTKNVDSITGVPMNNNTGSLGTGIVGGYYNPIAMGFVVENNAKDKAGSPDGQGVKELVDLVVRTQGFPSVDTYDVIVKAETNQRYYVTGISSVPFPGTEITLMQKLDLKLIPITDKLYKLEVPPYRVTLHPADKQPGV